MARRPLAILYLPLALLAAVGCQRYPEDPIFAYGAVLAPDGGAQPDVALTVERAEVAQNRREPTAPPEYQPWGALTSGDDGQFVFEVLLRDARWQMQGQDALSRQFRISTPESSQGSAWVSFDLSDDVEIPPLRAWAVDLERVDEAAGPALRFSPPPPAPEMPPSAKQMPAPVYPDGTVASEQGQPPVPILQILSGADRGLLWQQVDPASPWAPTPWMLEDFAGLEAQARAATWGTWYFEPLGGHSSRSMFRVDWSSQRLAWPSGTRTPASRGAACRPATAEPCPWTDGKLVATALRPDPTMEPVTEVGVSLPAPRALSRAVVRGLGASGLDYWSPSSAAEPLVVVEGSADGVQWAILGTAAITAKADLSLLANAIAQTAPGPSDAPLRWQRSFVFADVALDPATPVREVRLQVVVDGARAGLTELAELSLFE